ncbi:conserved hypothetical protein [Cellulomonas flavigena DSM 20109]|uniref:Uncharacterized protein n=2 Tax=Cellulomonas flavigena TaxID=1711 RepID=D5UHL6_CELFN|nr:conserved hypothetical protein [Cellulomonas flavigena DSM 20109]
MIVPINLWFAHAGAMTQLPALGIDIGRVIIDGGPGADTAFFGRDEAAVLATPEVPGAIDTIARLTALVDGRVWLVSKCALRIQERTLRWLEAHDVHGRTGIPTDHVRFCRRREEKRGHCLDLGLTHFVDDHPEVHRAIAGAVRHQYRFGSAVAAPPAVATPTWADVERLVRTTLEPAPVR